MSQRILITRFNYSMPAAEFRAILASVAQPFAEVPGCVWKIWLIDEAKSEGGAVYLFQDQQALDTFKNSELVASVVSDPAFSNFDFRETDIVKEPSLITKAPLMDMAVTP